MSQLQDQKDTPTSFKPVNEFIPPPLPKVPTHEAYFFDKVTQQNTVVAQGDYKEIKWFVQHSRTPSKWLYMREITEAGADDAGDIKPGAPGYQGGAGTVPQDKASSV
jgi:hypothetical protein